MMTTLYLRWLCSRWLPADNKRLDEWVLEHRMNFDSIEAPKVALLKPVKRYCCQQLLLPSRSRKRRSHPGPSRPTRSERRNQARQRQQRRNLRSEKDVWRLLRGWTAGANVLMALLALCLELVESQACMHVFAHQKRFGRARRPKPTRRNRPRAAYVLYACLLAPLSCRVVNDVEPCVRSRALSMPWPG